MKNSKSLLRKYLFLKHSDHSNHSSHGNHTSHNSHGSHSNSGGAALTTGSTEIPTASGGTKNKIDSLVAGLNKIRSAYGLGNVSAPSSGTKMNASTMNNFASTKYYYAPAHYNTSVYYSESDNASKATKNQTVYKLSTSSGDLLGGTYFPSVSLSLGNSLDTYSYSKGLSDLRAMYNATGYKHSNHHSHSSYSNYSDYSDYSDYDNYDDYPDYFENEYDNFYYNFYDYS